MNKFKLDKKKIICGLVFLVAIIIFNVAYWHNRALEDGYYYIDIDGNIVSGRYGFVSSFKNGVAILKDNRDDEERYYLNTDLNIIGTKKYDFDSIACSVYNGEAIFTVLEDDSIDILDKDMKQILSIPYDAEGSKYVDHFSGPVGVNGLFPIKDRISGKWGYMDLNGNMVIEPKFFGGPYHGLEAFNEDGVAVVYDPDSKLYGIIDSNGNYKVEPSYDEIKLYGNGIALVMNKEEDKYAAYFVDLEGNRLSDERYDIDVNNHAVDGHIPVKNLQGFCGYINLDMSPLTELKYKKVYDFYNGMAVVINQDGLYGYIDTTGKEVIPCQFEGAEEFGEYDLAMVRINGKCGLVRKDGSFYTEPLYDYIWPFSSGYSAVYLHKGQKVKICK